MYIYILNSKKNTVLRHHDPIQLLRIEIALTSLFLSPASTKSDIGCAKGMGTMYDTNI